MKKHFFAKKAFYFLILLVFLKYSVVYSQYVEFGEYQYRVDNPPIKIFITNKYENILNIVDSNSVQDKFTKRVIIVNRKSYNILINYIKAHTTNKSDSINSEHFQYVRVYDREKDMSDSYKFSLDGYKSYLIDLFKYIEKNDLIIKEDKTKIISKLKYWQ